MPTADEVLIRIEEIVILFHALGMVSLVAVPVVAEAEVAAVLADEAEVALLPVGLGLGLGLGLALAHRPRHAPTRAATGPCGGFLGLPLPHPARRLRDGTEAIEAGGGI